MVDVIFLPSLKCNLKTIFDSFELQSGAKCLILVTEINRINVKMAAGQNRTVSNYYQRKLLVADISELNKQIILSCWLHIILQGHSLFGGFHIA